MRQSRLIINNVTNFKATMILGAIMLVAIGMILSVSIGIISGKLVTADSVEGTITTLVEENTALKTKLLKIETANSTEVKAITANYEAKFVRQEELIASIDNNLDSLSYYYTEYDYIFKDAKSANNPMKLSDVVKMDQEAKKRNLDPHLLASIIFTESGYDMKAKSSISTATGAGQILRSTGKFIHTKLLGYDTEYTHDMALDSIKNIEMMAAYIEYLYKSNDTAYGVIKSYSGDCMGDAYQRKVYNYMMKNVGYSDKSLDV